MYTEVDYEYNTLLQEKVHDIMHTELGVKVDGAHYSPAFKRGFWDGITDFYDYKEDKFHTGLLPKFLKGIRKLIDSGVQVQYEIIDKRPPQTLHQDSIDEEIVLKGKDGEELILRDYQYEAVRSVFTEKIGIVNIATNGGKTLASAGVMQQILPYLKDGERIAFFTHSRELFSQSAEAIQTALGLRDNEIGRIGDGKFDIKNKKIVFVMIPTLNSALKDPRAGVKFTPKERVIKFIAEEVQPKFAYSQNTRKLLRNYIKNSKLKTKIWESALEQLQYVAYDDKFTDKTAKMHLNKYVVEFNKIMEKKNKAKFDKYNDTMEFLESVKLMVADEVHRAKADTWYVHLSKCINADYRVGLTGTVDKKDAMGWQRLQAVFNQVISKVSNDYLISIGVSSKPIIKVIPMKEPRDIELIDDYLSAYKAGIVENEVRNDAIVKLAIGYNQRKPGGILISVREIEHGETILEKLDEQGMDADFIHGGSTDEHRAEILNKFSQGELDVMIASTIIDEGVDMKSIGCMILGAGGKSMRQQLQRIGRGLRLNDIDGNRVIVFDFYDSTNRFLKAHSKERIKIFEKEKFDVEIVGK